MRNLRTFTGFAVIILVTALASVMIFDRPSWAASPSASRVISVPMSVRFCEKHPDITPSLRADCVRVDLTRARSNGQTTWTDGRVHIKECVREAYAPDSGYVRTRAERTAFIGECLRSFGL